MGNLLDIIKGKDIRPNPNYNPKTKKGALEPPYVVNTNPLNRRDFAEKVLKVPTMNAYGLTSLGDPNKYSNYGVTVNPINTDEELNKERAQNQSALEQTGRMLGQAVGSEIILGSLRGFSDIIDAGVELFTDNKDFTNPISQALEEAQNSVRERLEIYRENPEDAWDITDYGWWTNNAVSIASTLSLAIPGGIYTKALGLLGKSLNASKALRAGLSLVSKHPNLRTKQLESILGLGAHAGLMRTAEGYIEARDTYTQVKDEISNKLAEMNPNEKAELIKRNPSFKGLTDEEIAEKAAGDSAEDVFKDDYWLMLLDAWQLKSLRNLGKGFKNIATTSSIRESQRKSIDALVNRTTAPSKGLKNYFNNLDASSFKVIGAELSEGFEEGYQYIQQQEGIDKARKIIEPNYKARGYAEYLTDPHMWEQAFWGWMGGVAFQGLGSAANKIAAKYISKNEDVLTRQRKAEIEGRISTITNFATNIAMIRDENKNPFTNLPEAPDIVDESERDALIEYAFEKLITDMTIEATKKGNFDLLKEFFASDEFQEHMEKTGAIQTAEQKQYIADVVKHMDEVYDVFEGEVNHIIDSDITNQGVINKIASDNTYLKLASRSAQNQIDKFDAQINEARKRYAKQENIIELIDVADKAVKLEVYKEEIDRINEELRQADADLKAKKINRAEHSSLTRNKQKEKQALYRDLGFTTSEGIIKDSEFYSYYNEHKAPNAINNIAAIDNVAHAAIYNKAYNALNKAKYYDNYIVSTKAEIQTKAKQVEGVFNEARANKAAEAILKLNDIYENNDIDTVLDYLYGNKEVNLTDEVKSAIDKAVGDIKVYDESDETYAHMIVSAAESKAKQKAAKPTTVVNGNAVNTPPNNPTPPNPQPVQPVNNTQEQQNIQAGSGASPSPTGGLTPQELGLATSEEETANKAQLEAEKKAREQEQKDDIGAKINDDVKAIGLAGLQDNDFISLSVDEKIENIKNQLRHKGYKEKDINDNDSLIKSWVRIIQGNINSRRRSALTIDTITKEDIVGEIALGFELTDDFFELAIAKFKKENQVLELNGKVYFNMISFLKYLANSNEISTFETLKAVYTEFFNYINNNDKYSFVGNARVNDATLNKIVEGLDLNSIDTDNRIGLLSEKNRTPEYLLALNNIKPGDNLKIFIERSATGTENGISFWKTIYINGRPLDVKIAFNKFGKKGKYNNSYYVTSGAFSYNIWQDANGQYHSDLDDIFDKLMADEDKLSPDAIEFLEYLLDNTKLTKTNANQFWNNSIAKELLKFASNKNTNFDTARNLLNSVRNIYNYDNGDHFDKRQSFKIWIRKEYNNYKFTDDLRNANEVSVKFISEGTLIPSEKTDIDKAVVNFNLNTHHLGFVNGNEEIVDATTNEVKQAPGFRHRGLVVMIPNGTKAPLYSKIFAQQVDYTKGFGKAIRDEVRDAIVRHITAEDNFDTTVEKLMSIFNYSGFVSDVLCKEFDGRIIIASADSDIPIITIYKKQADKVTDSTGISVNLGTRVDQSVGAIELNADTEELLNKGLDKLLANSTYALSYDFIDATPTTNKYVTKNPDKSLTITIGGQTFNYINYLDFIVKNGVGKIALGKQDLGYGIQTNFLPSENNQLGNANIRVEVPSSATPRRGESQSRIEAIETIETEGNKNNKAVSTLIKAIAPSFVDFKILKQDDFLGAKVNIKMETHPETKDGYVVRAEYNKKTKKITLYKEFFDIAKTKDGEYHAMRILIHENIHRAINEIENPFEREDFVDGLREIRDIFLDALESGTSRNDTLVQYLQSIGEKPEEKIAIFKSMFDNNKDELYNLEEFIAESLTSKLLQNVLNNIESSRNVTVQNENLSLWQRIIQVIRKLFGFEDIKDNTLLAQEFEIFSNNFKLNRNEESVVTEQEQSDNEDSSYEDSDGYHYDDTDGTGDETFDEDYEDDSPYSAIQIDSVPNIVAVASQLSISERAEFDTLLDAGYIQMYCR